MKQVGILVGILSLAAILGLSPAVGSIAANRLISPGVALTANPRDPNTLGACESADILGLIGKGGLLQSQRPLSVAIISQRINGCRAEIKSYQEGTPAPKAIVKVPDATPTPGRTAIPRVCAPSGSDPLLLYNLLLACSSWVSRNIPAPPSPSPASTPSFSTIQLRPPSNSVGLPWTKAIYVMALANDVPTSAQITLQLTRMLEHHLRPDIPNDPFRIIPTPVRYSVITASGMTLTQYQQQCYNDPSTAGAIVVLQPSTQSFALNYLVTRSWTVVGLQAMVLNCVPTNPWNTSNAAFITSIEKDVHTGKGVGGTGLSLASVLAVLSGVLALHPVQSTSYTTVPPNPLPSAGSGQSYQTGYSVGTSQGAVTAVAAAGVAALTPLSSTSLGYAPGTDALTAGGVADALGFVTADLLEDCRTVDYFTTAHPADTVFEPTQCNWLTRDAFR